jgi:hypothetical protein
VVGSLTTIWTTLRRLGLSQKKGLLASFDDADRAAIWGG